VSYESEASSRGHCAIGAAGGNSLGRVLFNLLRHFCRVSLVQHDVSMMRAKLLTGVAVLLLSAGTAHAAERTAHAAVLITNTENW
jgi:hypothetical protein